MVNLKWTLFTIHSHNYKIMNMNFYFTMFICLYNFIFEFIPPYFKPFKTYLLNIAFEKHPLISK